MAESLPKRVENSGGNGEISPFPTVFLPFAPNLKPLSANSFSLESSEICCLGKD